MFEVLGACEGEILLDDKFFLLLIYLGYTSPLDSHFVSKAGDLLSKLFGMPKLVLIKMVFYVEV